MIALSPSLKAGIWWSPLPANGCCRLTGRIGAGQSVLPLNRSDRTRFTGWCHGREVVVGKSHGGAVASVIRHGWTELGRRSRGRFALELHPHLDQIKWVGGATGHNRGDSSFNKSFNTHFSIWLRQRKTQKGVLTGFGMTPPSKFERTEI